MRDHQRVTTCLCAEYISEACQVTQVAEHQLDPEVKVFDSVLGKQMALIHCEPVE